MGKNNLLQKTAAAGLLLACAASAEAGKFEGFYLGIGGAHIPEFAAVQRAAYPDNQSLWDSLWGELRLGASYAVVDQLSVDLRLDGLLHYYADASTSHFDSLILPGLGAVYVLSPGPPSLYIGADVSFPLFSTGSERFSLESDGPGLGLTIGWVQPGILFEIGYRLLPVRVSGPAQKPRRTLGCVSLRMMRPFSLGTAYLFT